MKCASCRKKIDSSKDAMLWYSKQRLKEFEEPLCFDFEIVHQPGVKDCISPMKDNPREEGVVIIYALGVVAYFKKNFPREYATGETSMMAVISELLQWQR